MQNFFVVPDFENFSIPHGDSNNKVVVISIIGKSAFNASGLKVKSIGRKFHDGKDYDDKYTFEGFYDNKNHIIYLHLHCLLDTDTLLKQYSKVKEYCDKEYNCNDFLTINDVIKSSFARCLLFMLHVSHLVVLSHPGSTFDTNYIQYFKAVDLLSKNLYDKISETLKTVECLSTEWIGNGRFCTPRLIFFFERHPKNICKSNIKKLEHNMEDQIYHILKKTRIVSTTGCSLFAIPMNDEFVYISNEGPADRLGQAIRGLIEDCQPGKAVYVEPPYCSQPSSEKNFIEFLQVHVKQARGKGFDDTITSNRHQHSPAYFELPTLKNWIEAVKVLYPFLIINKMVTSLCTDTRFSEQRCLKVLPLAVAKYQDGLPPHYARTHHEAQLNIALCLFRTQARGPVFHKYAKQLRNDCEAYWENGRQQCEAASMTGNPCKLPKHSTDQEHISGFVYKSVCDCGRKNGPREDPYTAKQANNVFYQQMAKECQCSKLERISFPVFEPSTQEYKAASISETEDNFSALSIPSAELTPDEKCLVRQPSTTEYLPGMLTLNSPPSLLPVYASWSLVCLGASSLYSHNLGLSESHHPGFLSSTNYLLPWDVTVGNKSKSNWSANSKFTPRGRRGRPAGTVMPQTVKVFIGVEYECTSGHRFMLSAPDKILKAAPGSIVKDTGHKIAESDMPLYFSCSCRANKLAQLMRLHVVTPKAPVHCTLNPKVQPVPGGPVFIPTVESPIKLTQSAYWVMRLPYVYVLDKDNFPQNLGGKLIQGVFGVAEVEL